MTKQKLSNRSVEALIERYVDCGLTQSAARTMLDVNRANRMYDEMKLIADELTSRGKAAQEALVPLMDHPNDAVRGAAAWDCHSIAPAKARHVLEEISQTGEIVDKYVADARLSELGYPSRRFRTKRAPTQ